MRVFEAKKNTDQTEGRGPLYTFAIFTTEEEAVKAVKGQGVMGVGDGEVYKTVVYETAERAAASLEKSSEKVYGYRQDRLGRWGEGYVDNRETKPLEEDPEYKEFLRLKAKYGRR